VRDRTASGMEGSGLGGEHCGRSLVTCVEVAVQVNVTGLENPVVVLSAMVAVAVPPGSTPARGESADAVSVKFCTWANVTWAAANKNSNRAKTAARRTCLALNMNG
jgi:hypothetical protein